MPVSKGLVQRLNDGETILVAEGYLFEFESRGLLSSGAFVPEVVLDHPDIVRQLHREFVWAGSDVVLAYTYYAHRSKLSIIGRESDLERMNRAALKIAREVADETGTLMAGNISNTTVYVKDDPKTHEEVYKMFEEQVKWAVEGGADYIVGETFDLYGEAALALKAIKEFGNGLPAVMSVSAYAETLFDGVPVVEACQKLEQDGAVVVGLNCSRGPRTIVSVLKEVRAACKGPVSCLPVCYRTNEKHVNYYCLPDLDDPSKRAFPLSLLTWQCSHKNIADFTREAKTLGIQYMGLCCGNRPALMRTMAETIGRKPPASKYSPDMSVHFLNTNPEVAKNFSTHKPKTEQ